MVFKIIYACALLQSSLKSDEMSRLWEWMVDGGLRVVDAQIFSVQTFMSEIDDNSCEVARLRGCKPCEYCSVKATLLDAFRLPDDASHFIRSPAVLQKRDAQTCLMIRRRLVMGYEVTPSSLWTKMIGKFIGFLICLLGERRFSQEMMTIFW